MAKRFGVLSHNLRRARILGVARGRGSRRVTIKVQVGRAFVQGTAKGDVGPYNAMACISSFRAKARCNHAYGKSPTKALRRAVNGLMRKLDRVPSRRRGMH